MSRRIATSSITLNVGPSADFPTIQEAVNAVLWEWDLRGHGATIQVADGVYSGRVRISGLPPGATRRPAISIVGNVGEPSRCSIEVEQGHAFDNWGSYVEIAGFKISASGCCLFGHDSGLTVLGAIEFGDSGRDHILCASGHIVRHSSDYSISGRAKIHAHVVNGGFYTNGQTVTLRGSPHFSEEFHGLSSFAKSSWAGTRFIGAATGVRHLVHFNSICAIGGADVERFFPGDKPGTVSDFSTMA